MRLRYRGSATPWYELLNLSATELEGLSDEAGWRLAHMEGEPPEYYAVLEKVVADRGSEIEARAS